MISLRKCWWTAVVLAAVGGCNSDEPAANPGAEPTTTSPAASAPPGGSPAATADPGKAAPKAEPAPPAIEAPATKPADKKDEAPKKDDEKKADTGKLSDEEIAQIKKLPAAEQDLALKQVVCPVSDEHLGEMGVPYKVTAEGKTFYLCCKTCEKEVKKDPKAVIAKLKN